MAPKRSLGSTLGENYWAWTSCSVPLRRGAVALNSATVLVIAVPMIIEHLGAERRLATFVLWAGDEQAERSPHLASSPMSQKDIGNYLGLVPETVSRGPRPVSRPSVVVNRKTQPHGTKLATTARDRGGTSGRWASGYGHAAAKHSKSFMSSSSCFKPLESPLALRSTIDINRLSMVQAEHHPIQISAA